MGDVGGAVAAGAGGACPAAGPASRVGGLRVRRRRRGAALEVEELGGDRHAGKMCVDVANCCSSTCFSSHFL